MVQTVRSPILRYGIAILSVAIALGLKLLIEPLVQVETPFLLLFAAIMVAALVGGRPAGILATILAAAASNYFFFPPKFSFRFGLGESLQLGLFILEGILVTQVIVALTSARRNIQLGQEALHHAYADLEQRVHDRTAQLSEANQQLQQQITEREQMEQAIRESDRRFRAIFNQTFQFIGLLQPDGTLIEANQTALDFAGLHSGDVINRPFWEAYWWTISEDTQNRLRAAIAEAATGKFIRYEAEVRGQEGAIATIDFSIKPIKDETGQVVLLIPEGRDITALKQSQQALGSFFDSASMMMGIVELVGDDILHIIDNVAAGQFFGTAPEHLKQRLASELGTPKDNIQIWLDHYREAERCQAPVRFEYPHVSAEGQQFWLSATVCQIPGHFADRARFAYIVEDISDRKQAQIQLETVQQALQDLNAELEERVQQRTAQLETMNLLLEQEVRDRRAAEWELARSEQQFRLLTESMPQIVWTSDPAGAVDYYNQRWAEYSGVPVQQGHGWGWQPVLHPEDEQRTLAAWAEAIQTGQLYECEHRIRRADGEFRWFLSRGLPLKDHQGQIVKWFGTATDIHEQKQVQEALRESQKALYQSEQQFRATFNQAAVGIAQVGLDGRWLRLNQKLCEIVGYTEEDLLQKTFQDITYPPDLAADLAQAARLLANEIQTYSMEKRYIRKDGSLVWINLTSSLVRESPAQPGQLGEPRYFIAIVQDISDRKQAEEALRQSKERFRVALDNIPDVFVIYNADRRMQFVNAEGLRRTARPLSDFLGYRDEEIHPPEVYMAYLPTLLRSVETRTTQTAECTIHLPTFGTYTIVVTYVPLLNDQGELQQILGITHDITERKQAEEALRLSAERFRVALQHSPIAVFNQDRDLHYTWIHNPKLGYALEDVLGKSDFELMDAATATVLSTIKQQVLRSGVGSRQEVRATSEIGESGYYDLTVEPLRDEAGQIVGITAAAVDITERKQIEAELLQANRLKDEFLATISHELRTPLNSMLGWANLLPTRQFDATTTARAIDSISRNTQILAQLVEDVLDMSDILTGQLKLQMAPVDLALITEQAIAALDVAAQAKQIQIKTHSTLTTELVLGDPARLQQVIWNLLSNAIKFTPTGGKVDVRLAAIGSWESGVGSRESETAFIQNSKFGSDFGELSRTADSPEAKIQNSTSLSLSPTFIRITVTDTGKGISPDFLPFVFDRFRQEDGSTTRSQGGLGLGLAIVRYLVELHGGTIQVSSPGINQGTTFTVLLPIAQ